MKISPRDLGNGNCNYLHLHLIYQIINWPNICTYMLLDIPAILILIAFPFFVFK